MYFDLVVMRDARQGFFDVAVTFEDIFCSAKVDCVDDDDGPLTLVHDPATGERVPSLVWAFVCTDGDDATSVADTTHLYVDDLALRCGDDLHLIDLGAGPGNLYPDGDGAPPPLVQAMAFLGTHVVTNQASGVQVDTTYWNVALGFDAGWIVANPTAACALEGRATAASGPLPSGVTPEDTNYPIIEIDIPVIADGAVVCTRHPLGEDGVVATYTGPREDGAGFVSTKLGNEAVVDEDGDVSSAPTPPILPPGCTPDVEICNGVDDDCNGLVDEQAARLGSGFEGGLDGWGASGDYKQLAVQGGVLTAADVGTGDWWYFVAPATWGGDRRDLIGGTLTYWQRVSSATHASRPHAVVIESGHGVTLQHAGVAPPTSLAGAWFERRLLPDSWRVVATGEPPSAAEFEAVMGDITAIRILGEWNALHDRSWLDDIALARAGGAGGGDLCATGMQGPCATSVMACDGGELACAAVVTPQAEVCNLVDDDCDGVVDDVAGVGEACATGGKGVCAAGVRQCGGAGLECVALEQASAETCDGADDDCDGAIDEGNPGGNVACTTGELGVCSAGVTQCQSGALTCKRSVNPSAELCNQLDDDCDGVVDDACAFAVSTFDSNRDDWTKVGNTAQTQPTWSSSGEIYLKDRPGVSTFRFVAPSKFRGDLSGLYGGSFSFRLRNDIPTSTQQDGVRITGSNDVTIVAVMATPTTHYKDYGFTLSADAQTWRILANNAAGELATEVQIRGVLSNVTTLTILADWGVNDDTTHLDDVYLRGPGAP